MAQAIPFHTPPYDSRGALGLRIERAPETHAEAILAAYDLLQALQDRGILETATSALRAGDEILAQIVEDVNTPQAIRALRNLVILQKMLGSIDPASFQELFQPIPASLVAAAKPEERVGILRLLRLAFSKDSLRGIAAALDFLESFGRRLRTLEASSQGQR